MQVCAVIVTHRPALDALAAQLARLAPQVWRIVIVDNASADETLASLRTLASTHRAVLLENPRNLGVAEALNRGIAHARSEGATHVLLMDQDSLPAADMLARLAGALQRMQAQGRVAAVGPVAEDLRTGQAAPFVRVGFPLNRKVMAVPGEIVACDFLITSGCLVPLAVIDAVGDMEAALFIDNVDLEWSFRAARAGFTLHGVGDARMGHRIGDEVRRVRLGTGFVHSPTRLYYMMRNRVLLYRRAATPARWVAQDIPRAVLKLLRFSLVVAPRRANARAMLAGLRDGLAGRSGAKPEPNG